MFPGAPPPVLAVVVVGTGITLAAEPRGLLARLRLIVPQHVGGLCTGGQRQGSGRWGRSPGAEASRRGMNRTTSSLANAQTEITQEVEK